MRDQHNYLVLALAEEIAIKMSGTTILELWEKDDMPVLTNETTKEEEESIRNQWDALMYTVGEEIGHATYAVAAGILKSYHSHNPVQTEEPNNG